MLYTHAGPEIAVASTKAFLAQITACYLLGLYLAQLRGGTFADDAAAVHDRAARRAGQDPAGARPDGPRRARSPRFMADTRSVLFLGRHVGYPVALEGALKLKELAYIHAEGFAAGELKHGPIALIEPGQPVFVVVPVAATRARRCTARSSPTSRRSAPAAPAPSSIAEEGDEDVVPFADEVIRVPATLAAARAAAHRRAAAGLRAASWRRPRASTSTSRATSPSRSRSSDGRR